MSMRRIGAVVLAVCGVVNAAFAQVAVRAGEIHTVSGGVIRDGVVVVTDGVIAAVGPASEVAIPAGHEVLEAAVVTPGLIDAHATAGLTGIYNARGQAHDQDMIERSSPIQPGLRAIDAYNPREDLVVYIRSFGVTTIHTGHAPGELVSGQTLVAKTRSTTIDDAVMEPFFAVVATLDTNALKSGGKSPGTRGKAVSMLRQALIDTRVYMEKLDEEADGEAGVDDGAAEGEEGGQEGREGRQERRRQARDLTKEALASVLRGEKPLIVTANRAQDIASALRLAEEFGFELWLDSAAEAYTLADEIAGAGVPVLVHPTMVRHFGSYENASFTTAAELDDAGIAVALQSGYESYVPKVRVVLFEAAIAAAHGGLGFERALRSITLTPAELLGIDDRVGSIEVGKHGDLALYTGDPFEYTTRCVGTIIEGEVVSRGERPNESDDGHAGHAHGGGNHDHHHDHHHDHDHDHDHGRTRSR